MIQELLLAAVLAAGGVYLAMQARARRLRAEVEKLRANERRFRDLTELSADWFWETDEQDRVTWVSGGASMAMLFGDAKTYGRRFWEIPGIEIDPHALERVKEGLAARQPFFDLEISRRDERGARLIHIISGQSRNAADGTFLGYRGVGRDITEQRRAEQDLFRAKERLELALDGGNLAEWHLDLANNTLYAGDGWVRFLGRTRSPQLTRGEQILEAMHADDREPVKAALLRALKGATPRFEAEFRIATHDGEWKWLQARGRVAERDRHGRALYVSGTVADIDERKRAEAALAEREQRFRDVAEASGEYVWETDASWRYTYLSERVEKVLGYTRAELIGRRPHELMPLGESRAVEAWLAEHAPDGRAFRELVHRTITRSGAVMWQSLSAVPLRDSAGRFAGYRGTAADVTPRKQAEARADYLATRDALTGLPNRVLLADRAAQAILAAARARTQLALLCIDVDRFKLVNEAYGHPTGDALLRAIAERLQGLLGGETLARPGGDELVLLIGVRSTEEAARHAQRILDALARPFTVDGRTLGVSASIGVSLYPSDGRDLAELLRNADAAMYHAKAAGGGAWRLFEAGMHARALERLRLENELRGALARGELLLHWHPVVRGRRHIVGGEALVRWQHPERGLLLPEDFVPIAEESGLIRALGEFTLERAVAQAGAWHRARPGRAWFAVNVSAPELAQGEAYVQRLRSALEASQLPGTALELEVTERVLMTNADENLETLERLRALGVRLVVDDFGTGYSSLAYLRHLPVQKLKIDRSFLRSVDAVEADEAIVRAIATLAKALGIAVAGEGIESEAQLARLLALGCDEWQGHYCSPPLDAASFEKLLLRDIPADRSA